MIVLREPKKCLSVVREERALPFVKSERTINNNDPFISKCIVLCWFLCASVLPLVAVSKVEKIANKNDDILTSLHHHYMFHNTAFNKFD